MFFEDPNRVFRIIGVFYVERSACKKVIETNRNHISIAYRIKGESQLITSEGSQLASGGSVTYIPAHTDYVRKSTEETLLIIHLQGFHNMGSGIEIVENAEAVEPLFRKLLSVWETKDSKMYNRSIQLLYSIFEALQNIAYTRPTAVSDVIAPGVKLLHTRYSDPSLRIADLADACFISDVYFRNIYHRFFGESPQQTLAALRFSHVCELLCSGYYSQKEAAQLVGFSDVKYFRTAFKKHFGLTPGEYIKKCRSATGSQPTITKQAR